MFFSIDNLLLWRAKCVLHTHTHTHARTCARARACVCVCSAQCRNRDDSGIVLRKVGIPTLSADSGIVPDNSRIAQGIYILL